MQQPYNKWEGVKGSGSTMSDNLYVRGQLFKTASISTIKICNASRVMNDLPITFLPQSLSHSDQPLP